MEPSVSEAAGRRAQRALGARARVGSALRRVGLASFVAGVLGLAATSAQASEGGICPTYGDFDGPTSTFGAEAGRHIVVLVRGVWEPKKEPAVKGKDVEPDAASADASSQVVFPPDGIGFAVSRTTRKQVEVEADGTLYVGDPCGERVVWIATAHHNVYRNGEGWADKIFVALIDQPASWIPIAWEHFAKNNQESEAQREMDVVLLPVSLGADFVWPGFRYAIDVPDGEEVRYPHYDDTAAQIIYRKGAMQSFEMLTRLVGGNVVQGDSGAPVFDRNWQIVGMMTNTQGGGTGGVLVPSESISAVLQALQHTPNWPTVRQIAKAITRERRGEVKGGNTGGLFRIESGGEWLPQALPSSVRFSGELLPSLGISGPFGVRFLLGYQLSAGYQKDYGGVGQAGVEVGVVGYLDVGPVISFMPRWSPSFLLWRDAEPILHVAVPAYTFGLRVAYKGYGLGVDLRKVSPPDSRPSWVEQYAYFYWGDE